MWQEVCACCRQFLGVWVWQEVCVFWRQCVVLAGIAIVRVWEAVCGCCRKCVCGRHCEGVGGSVHVSDIGRVEEAVCGCGMKFVGLTCSGIVGRGK